VINQFLRLGFLVVTGRFFKPRIKGLMLLAVIWLVLWFVHSEYVSYVELSNDRSLVLYASVAKLVLYALSVGCYVLMVERPLWPKPTKAPPPINASRPATAAPSPATSRVMGEDDDGFDFLRRKGKLKSSREKLLNK
jgi:hypothetical protein